METSQIKKVIFGAIEMINNLKEDDAQIPLSETTVLFGKEGHLDSMGLVSFLIEIEESLQDEGFELSLSDDRAMSQTNSPFADVTTLTNYISELMAEA